MMSIDCNGGSTVGVAWYHRDIAAEVRGKEIVGFLVSPRWECTVSFRLLDNGNSLLFVIETYIKSSDSAINSGGYELQIESERKHTTHKIFQIAQIK